MADIVSRQEVIKFLRDKVSLSTFMKRTVSNADKACIELCEKIKNEVPPAQQWTPVSEGLPKDDTEVIVSCTDDSGDYEYSYTTTGWHFKGVWVVGNERSYFVRAWMPLPEPWGGEKK